MKVAGIVTLYYPDKEVLENHIYQKSINYT